MQRKSIVFTLILMILISFSVFSSTEKVIEVGPEGSGYSSILEALEMVKDGDTILLTPGEYFVSELTVGKNISFKGTGVDEVVLNILGEKPLLIMSIAKNEFILSDMTIKSDGLAVFARGYEKGEGNIHMSNLKIFSKGCGIDLVGFGSSVMNCEITAIESVITVRSTSEYLTTSSASHVTRIENCVLKVNDEGLTKDEIADTAGITFNGTGYTYLNNNEFVNISKTVVVNGYRVFRDKP